MQSRVTGYNVCLGSVDKTENGREYRSWSSLVAMTKITTTATYLKMDIEGAEYGVVAGLLAVARADWIGSFKVLPGQVSMEVHLQYFADHAAEGQKLLDLNQAMMEAGYALYSAEHAPS